jgi:hypothetical protein
MILTSKGHIFLKCMEVPPLLLAESLLVPRERACRKTVSPPPPQAASALAPPEERARSATRQAERPWNPMAVGYCKKMIL